MKKRTQKLVRSLSTFIRFYPIISLMDLYLFDANSLIHRAFHALPPFVNKEGLPTGALYGLSNILLKVFREEKPDYAAAMFDRPEPTFRKDIFNDYKIQRPKAPDELISQIINAHQVFDSFGIRTFEIPKYEADDLIGTAAKKFGGADNLKITIVTGDLDDLQLVSDNKVVVKFLKRGVSDTEVFNEDGVKAKYGLPPGLLIDYKGLVGDASDNIPGAKGIGPKTAGKIVAEYGSLENYFTDGQLDKNYDKINAQKDIVLLSKELGKIKIDAPLGIENLEDLKTGSLNKEALISLFKKFGFESLLKRVLSY